MGPVDAGVMVADEIVGQRGKSHARDRIEGEQAGRRLEPAAVVNESEMIADTRLPVDLGKEDEIIATAFALTKTGIDSIQCVGDLLEIDRIVGVGGHRSPAESAGYGE